MKLKIPDAEIIFYPNFFPKSESDAFYEDLYRRADWKEERIKLYGKTVAMPRLTAWYGEPGSTYRYSGITVKPAPWTSALLAIKKKIEAVSQETFNGVLLNLYRNELDSVSWHSDDEPELGPVIGSVSLGETRRFQFKHKRIKGLRHEILLTHGSYLLMKAPTQRFWLHQIHKGTKRHFPRINLTFRKIIK